MEGTLREGFSFLESAEVREETDEVEDRDECPKALTIYLSDES